jgi:hypothetical protein
VCCTYILTEGGTEDRWSAGEVILVSDGSNIWDPEKARTRYKKGEGVVMRWDADEAREEPVSESAVKLLPSKWNPRGVQKAGGVAF